MTRRTASDILDQDFLDIRHNIINVAAGLDRISNGRAEDVRRDARIGQIREALSVLAESEPGRAERVQMVFSRAYDPQWQAR